MKRKTFFGMLLGAIPAFQIIKNIIPMFEGELGYYEGVTFIARQSGKSLMVSKELIEFAEETPFDVVEIRRAYNMLLERVIEPTNIDGKEYYAFCSNPRPV